MLRGRVFAATVLLAATMSAGMASARPGSAKWEAVPSIPVTLPTQLRYAVGDRVEDGKPVWQALRTEQNAEASIHTDTSIKHSGASSTRIDYRFAGPAALEYVQITTPLKITTPGIGIGIGFWYRFKGTSLPIRLRIADRSGETFQYDVAWPGGSGWQFAAITIGGPTSSWGGDGNGHMDFPCTLAGICIDRAAVRYAGTGSMWIDDFAFVTPRITQDTIRLETLHPRFGCIYDPGETVQVRASASGDAIRWKLTDFFGHTMAASSGPSSGTVARHILRQPGFYTYQFDAVTGGLVTESREYRCAVVPRGCPRSDFVGMCTHFGQGTYPLECMDLMLWYGIDQFRDEIAWGGCEPTKGAFAVPDAATRFLQHAAARKMRPLIIFDYANGSYDAGQFPNSADAIAGFARYAARLASATHDIVPAYEVWNEWIGGCGMNGRSGDHGPEAYGRLLQATYSEVKRAIPSATVVGIGGEYGTDCARNIAIAAKTAGPNSMDAFSIHPYRYPTPPEKPDLADEVKKITNGAAAGGAPRKVWVTEIGYPTQLSPTGSDERAQARHTVRTLTLLQSSGVVERVFWYDLKDDGLQRDYNEHNFGLVRHQDFGCAPKPSAVAVAALIRMTARAGFVSLKRFGDVYVSRYRRSDGQNVLVTWTTGTPRKCTVSGNLRQVVDIMGTTQTATRTIMIDANPLYLVGRGIGLRR